MADKENDTLKRVAEETPVAEEPVAKKVKTAEDGGADLLPIRKQVEYYFSDMNLVQDSFFHGKISSDPEGWLNIDLILSCKKIMALRATRANIITALSESSLETKEDGENAFVRRKEPLPELKARNQTNKPRRNPNEGGCVISIKNVPTGHKWGAVKDVIKVALPQNNKVQFSTNVDSNGSLFMLLTPWDGDEDWIREAKFKLADNDLQISLAADEELRKVLSDMPRHIIKRREAVAMERRKTRQRPFQLGDHKFNNAAALRGKMKEIIASRTDGMELKKGSPDFELVLQVLKNHPRAEAKLEGMTGLKVDVNMESRCFWILKGSESEDISVKKCIDNMEMMQQEQITKEIKAKAEQAAAAKAEEAKVEEAKVEEPKAEEAKAADAAPAQEAAAPAEEAAAPVEEAAAPAEQ